MITVKGEMEPSPMVKFGKEQMVTQPGEIIAVELVVVVGDAAALSRMAANDRRLTETLLSLNTRAINLPDNMGNTPLIYAAQNGSTDNIRVLLKYKVDPDYQNPANGTSALSAAAAAGQEKAAQMLVSEGADINLKDKEGRTPLFYAAENGQTALIRQLVRMGANPNETDVYGKNVFIAAAEGQSIPAMQQLVREGFSINSADANGKTALMYTTAKGTEALEWLIENGADLNLQDNNGNTALMHAHKNLNEKAALVLVKNDVDLTAVNKEGKDAFALAADLMPQSPVMTVLQVKKHTVLQDQLKARAAAQALGPPKRALAQEKLALAPCRRALAPCRRAPTRAKSAFVPKKLALAPIFRKRDRGICQIIRTFEAVMPAPRAPLRLRRPGGKPALRPPARPPHLVSP